MNDQNLKELEREQADNKLINDAFQHLIDTYVASRHRKKVDIVTKAFNFARQAHKGVRRLSTVVQSELEVVQMFGVKDRVSAHRKGINIPAPDTF